MDNQEEQLCGIFSIKGVRYENKVKINHLQNMKLKQTEYISDTLVNQYDICKGVVGEIYTCNFTHVYLMSSTKLPMAYVSVILDKPMRRVLLFRIYLFFIIKTEVKNIKQLLDEPLEGEFSLEITIENSTRNLGETIDRYPGDEKIYEKLTSFTMDENMKELIKLQITEVNGAFREMFKNDFNYTEPPKKTISLKDYLTD